jgi:hypothetical protein
MLSKRLANRSDGVRAALDELTPGKPIEHLRSVLVATAILLARDGHLARIERWVTRTLDDQPSTE